MVLSQHAGFMFPWNTWLGYYSTLLWHGAAGVDLFFTISGFVIARTLLPALDRAESVQAGLPVLRAFILRRFWRLQPAAWLWLAIPLPLCLVFNSSHIFQTLSANLGCALGAAFMLLNVQLGALPYGSPHAGLDTHYWSLSLEEQFYVLLPIAALLLRRHLVWALLALVLYQFALPFDPIYNMTRPGGLAAGVLLAIWSRHTSYAICRPRFLAGSGWHRLLFAGVCILSMGTLESWLTLPLFSVPYGMVAIVAGLLVYTASFDCGYIVQAGRVRDTLLWFGSRSYSIYLCHMATFAITRELYTRYPHVLRGGNIALNIQYALVAFLLTFAFAEITYQRVERLGRSPSGLRPALQSVHA